MAGIASFHLTRHRRAPAALVHLASDRVLLRRVPGLRFWRLLGTGRGSDTGFGADLHRTALFAVWDDEAALDDFLETSSIARRWDGAEETYSVRLRGVDGHGTWRGFDVLGAIAGGTDAGPVAVVTRADVHVRHWRSFITAGRPVSTELQRAPGLLAVAGIGEAPLGKQATFSLWRSTTDLRAFAYTMPRHQAVVRRTRAEGWYGEELFARFEPYASTGTWDGRDPLAGA
jgi:hypothetical protein